MTIGEAKEIYERRGNITPEEEYLLIEALECLVKETDDPFYTEELGRFYDERRLYEAALRYYEEAAEKGCVSAFEKAGNIYYYGRLGKKDHARAFACYSAGAEQGDPGAMMKLADMYKNGYSVRRDPLKSEKILEAAYELVRGKTDISLPVPEIATRLARMKKADGKIEETVRLYKEAKEILQARMLEKVTSRDLNTMEWLITDLHTMAPPDEHHPELFDLYDLMDKAVTVTFACGGKYYTAVSVPEDDRAEVEFEGDLYSSPADFIAHAKIEGQPLASLWDRISDITLKKKISGRFRA